MKKAILLLTAVCLSLIANGQSLNIENPNVIPPPPEASALFKSTEIPVSLSTGIPSINIPIYEIRLSDFTLPIALSYNSSGIRVDEMASSVGLGWALQAGGMISSSIFGTSDFETQGYMTLGTPFGPQDRELNPVHYWSGSEWVINDDYYYCFDVTGGIIQYGATPPTAVAVYDTQPDMYYYNFAGSSGKFFFTRDGKANTVPYRPILIERHGFTAGFTIKDEKGNLYTYGATERTLTSVVTTTAQTDFSAGTANTENYGYYLTRVETPKGEYIDITYSDISYVYKLPATYTRYRATGNDTEGMSQDAEVKVETTTTVYGKRIQSITSSKSHQVDFIYENCPRLDLPGRPAPGALTGSYALKQIQVTYGGTTNNFTLNHGYFNLSSYQPCVTTVSFPDDHRLKLLSIQKDGEPPHEFEYFGNNFLPNRLAEQADHWGYFKSGGGRYQLEPQNGFYTGGNRTPNLSDTKQGILTKIKYPTGGHTLFDYELNKARDTLFTQGAPQIHYADIYYDEQQSVQEVNFSITSEVDANSIQISYMTTGVPAQANLQFNVTLYGPNSYYRVFQSQEEVITDQIYLTQGDYTLRVEQVGAFEEGFVTLTYTTSNSGPPTVNITNVDVGGLRIRKIEDFKNDTDITPATTRYFTYVSPADATISSGKISNKPEYSYFYTKYVREFSNDIGNDFSSRRGIFWAQNSGSIQPLSGLQGYHVQYTDVRVTKDENGVIGYTDYKYSFVNDLISYITYPATLPTSYDWRRGLPLEENTYKYDSATSSYKPVSKLINKYKFYYTPPDYNQNHSESGAHLTPPTQPNENHVVAQTVRLAWHESRFDAARWPAEFEITSYKLISSWYHLEETTEKLYDANGANPVTKISKYYHENPLHAQVTKTEMQNSKGELSETRLYYPDDVTSTTSIGTPALTAPEYNAIHKLKTADGSNPTALHRISEPVQIEAIVKDGLGSELGKVTQRTIYRDWGNDLVMPEFIRTLKKDNAMENRLQFHSYTAMGNPREISRSEGPVTTYLWGYDDLYPIAKIDNATFAQVAAALGVTETVLATYDETNLSVINNLRNTLNGAMITTYTYKPLVGITTMTDPKGEVMNYSYDDYNRLKEIRDSQNNLVSDYEYHYKGQ